LKYASNAKLGQLRFFGRIPVSVPLQTGPRSGNKRGGSAPKPTAISERKNRRGFFRDAAYRGYIVLEYEEDEDPRVACPRYVDRLREAFA
jgi:hypothetical protein